MKKHFLLTILSLSIISVSLVEASGISTRDGGAPGVIFDFGSTARAHGMGGAHTAVADDAGAPYWNPAGLSQIERKSISLLYSDIEQDTSFSSLGVAQPTTRWGTFGLNVISLSSDGFDKRDSQGNQIGTADLRDSGFLLSHGIRLVPGWSIGATLKGVYQKIDTTSDSGFGLDLGTLVHLHPSIQWGFRAENIISPSTQLKEIKETHPRGFHLGLKWLLTKQMMIASDASKRKDQNTRFRVGAEWSPHSITTLRAGLNHRDMVFGLGLNAGDVGIDYAFAINSTTSDSEIDGSQHRVGLRWQFGKNIQEIRQDRKRFVWRAQAMKALINLRKIMESVHLPSRTVLSETVEEGQKAIQNNGFVHAAHLYEAQGYIYFLNRKYLESVYSLGEALNLAGHDHQKLKKNYEKAVALMNEDEKQKVIHDQVEKAKNYFEQNKLRDAIRGFESVLLLHPTHIEATSYLEDARNRLKEPIHRNLKIANLKMENGEYLNAIKYLQSVLKIDATNENANNKMSEAIAVLERQQKLVDNIHPDQHEGPRDRQRSLELYKEGLQHYAAGNLSDALQAWKLSLQYDPTNTISRKATNRAIIELKGQ